MKEAPFWKKHSLGMLALRIFLGVLGLAIAVWLVLELNSGGVHWSVANYVSSETTDMYVAKSPGAIFLATLTLGGLAFGLLVFSLYPRVLSHPFRVVFWIVIIAMVGILLRQYSERFGP